MSERLMLMAVYIMCLDPLDNVYVGSGEMSWTEASL